MAMIVCTRTYSSRFRRSKHRRRFTKGLLAVCCAVSSAKLHGSMRCNWFQLSFIPPSAQLKLWVELTADMPTAVLWCAAGRAVEEDGGSLKRKASRPHMIPRFGDPLSMRQPRAGKQAGLCSVLLEDSTPGAS